MKARERERGEIEMPAKRSENTALKFRILRSTRI
jgi:hypothetical protein